MLKITIFLLFWHASIGVCPFDGQTKKPANAPPSGYTLEDSIRGAKSFKPQEGFIPDAATAVKVAEAILIPIYGEKQVAAERPFKATLKRDTWTVAGTLASHLTGGTAVVKLSKSDGRVLFVIHTQ